MKEGGGGRQVAEGAWQASAQQGKKFIGKLLLAPMLTEKVANILRTKCCDENEMEWDENGFFDSVLGASANYSLPR